MFHKENKKLLSVMIGAALVAMSTTSYAANGSSMKIKNKTDTQVPAFVTGQLGKVDQKAPVDALKNILSSRSAFGAKGNENFTIKRRWVDSMGKSHTHFSQSINGLKVYGTSMTLHADLTAGAQNRVSAPNSVQSFDNIDANGDVYAVTGKLAVVSTPSHSSMMSARTDTADQATAAASLIGDVTQAAELAYVYIPLTDETKLVWKLEVTWDNGNADFGRDHMFYDATTSELVARHSQVYSIKSRKTYSLDNRGQFSAPGRLLCTDNQSCGDASAQRAHDGASIVYDYYKTTFSRDSIDANGMTMVSSVHLGNNEANAYWTGTQMLYGDGDGAIFTDLTLSLDVIGHELTHGVTQHTAGLIYQNASGALNEAWSDILGASAAAHHNGLSVPSWLLGKEVFTPGVSGDALRYMDNPTRDENNLYAGTSKDYYPERVPFVQIPTNANDKGDVHSNSGIANLAFALLVEGGTHPRGKTSEVVPAIGLAKAEKIFYHALVTYFGNSTNFFGARSGTAQAALDLYGATEKAAVESAWCAVGVGDCSSETPTPGSRFENTSDISIPDNSSAGVRSPISVTRTGIAGNINVNVNIIHPYIGDLIVTLESPSGDSLVLHNRSGSGADNINETYSVDASDESASGTWNLHVADRANRDVGTIDSWSIDF